MESIDTGKLLLEVLGSGGIIFFIVKSVFAIIKRRGEAKEDKEKSIIAKDKEETAKIERLEKELTEYKIKDAQSMEIIKGLRGNMRQMAAVLTIHYPEGAEIFKDV